MIVVCCHMDWQAGATNWMFTTLHCGMIRELEVFPGLMAVGIQIDNVRLPLGGSGRRKGQS